LHSHYTVVFDASVLYPAPIRDLLLQTASAGLFRGKLTAQINREWMSNLQKNRQDLNPDHLERTCKLMIACMPDCLVTGYELLISSLSLPDPDDRHVFAAAIHCNAQMIVTNNVRDFPAEELAKYAIEAQSADTFLRSQADLFVPRFLECVKAVRVRLKSPPVSAEDYLTQLGRQGLMQTASYLGDFVSLI
jgi:predicted nucleic acid-binding protein